MTWFGWTQVGLTERGKMVWTRATGNGKAIYAFGFETGGMQHYPRIRGGGYYRLETLLTMSNDKMKEPALAN